MNTPTYPLFWQCSAQNPLVAGGSLCLSGAKRYRLSEQGKDPAFKARGKICKAVEFSSDSSWYSRWVRVTGLMTEPLTVLQRAQQLGRLQQHLLAATRLKALLSVAQLVQSPENADRFGADVCSKLLVPIILPLNWLLRFGGWGRFFALLDFPAAHRRTNDGGVYPPKEFKKLKLSASCKTPTSKKV